MKGFDYPKSLRIPQLRNALRAGWPWLILIGAVQSLGFPAAYLGNEHDDALYVFAAQALREGHYRQWFLPGHLPLTQTTPGLPALLTPAAWLAPEFLAGYAFTLLILLWAADAALWHWLRRRHSPGAAAMLAAVILLNPLLLARVGVVMPEIPFLAVALWILSRDDRPGNGWGTGALLALAYLIRPAALPLWAAVGASLTWRRRWAELARTAFLPAVTYALWSAWCRSTGGVQESLELSARYGGHGLATAGAALLHNLRELATALGQPFLPLSLLRTAAAPALGSLLLIGALAGLARRLRRSPGDTASLFLGGSLLMHIFWPWWYYRYLVPLLPFLIVALAELRPTWLGRRPALALAGGVALLSWGFQGHGWTRGLLAHRTPALAEAYAWMKDNTSPADRFAGLLYGRDMLLGGRIVQPLPLFDDIESVRRSLGAAHIRYVLWEGKDEDYGLSDTARERPADRLHRLQGWLESPEFVTVFRAANGARIFRRVTPP